MLSQSANLLTESSRDSKAIPVRAGTIPAESVPSSTNIIPDEKIGMVSSNTTNIPLSENKSQAFIAEPVIEKPAEYSLDSQLNPGNHTTLSPVSQSIMEVVVTKPEMVETVMETIKDSNTSKSQTSIVSPKMSIEAISAELLPNNPTVVELVTKDSEVSVNSKIGETTTAPILTGDYYKKNIQVMPFINSTDSRLPPSSLYGDFDEANLNNVPLSDDSSELSELDDSEAETERLDLGELTEGRSLKLTLENDGNIQRPNAESISVPPTLSDIDEQVVEDFNKLEESMTIQQEERDNAAKHGGDLTPLCEPEVDCDPLVVAQPELKPEATNDDDNKDTNFNLNFRNGEVINIIEETSASSNKPGSIENNPETIGEAHGLGESKSEEVVIDLNENKASVTDTANTLKRRLSDVEPDVKKLKVEATFEEEEEVANANTENTNKVENGEEITEVIHKEEEHEGVKVQSREEDDEEDEDDELEKPSEHVKEIAKEGLLNSEEAERLQQQRKDAIAELTEIEVEFALLRDQLHQEKLSRYNEELKMCVNDKHPELLRVYKEIAMIRDEKIKLAMTRRKYKRQCIDNQTHAMRVQIHQQFMKDRADLRSGLLLNTTKEWYRVNRERRSMDSLVPEFGFRVPEKLSTQIKQRIISNYEVSLLAGISKYVGFPAAPEMKSANQDEIDEDLEAIRIPRYV